MPDERPPRRPVEIGSAGPGNVTFLDQALWRRFAEAGSVEEFAHAWLALQSSSIGGVSAGVVVLNRPDSGALEPVASWPPESDEYKSLGEAVDRALKEGKGVVLRDEGDEGDGGHQLAYPVLIDDDVKGVAALRLLPRPQPRMQAAMRQLQWGMAWLQNKVLRESSGPDVQVRQRLAAALDLTALVLEEPGFQASASAFVTELAARSECDRVSLGLVKGNDVTVVALSHSAQFGQKMNLIRFIGMAMSESIDQRTSLVYPQAGDEPYVLQAHEQLARTHGDRALCTVPLMAPDGRPLGALTLERAVAQPFERSDLLFCESVGALVGPIFEAKRANDRPLIAKVGDSAMTQMRRLFGPGHTVRKIVFVAALVLVLFFSFATGRYRVTAKTVLEGEVQRVVAAPFQGYVLEAPVRAGDIVAENETMCRLDERDLRLEYSTWSSEREQYVAEHRRAMAEGDLASMKVLTKKMRQVEAQIALLDEQISRTHIVAPFEGIVVSGDLSQSLGAPVQAGDILFEVAPLAAYRVLLQVDERDIKQVRLGQPGELILTALPEARFRFAVSKITPVSMTNEGRNYFLVEAALEEVSDSLRPGMEGFGKIEIDRRKLFWIWTHNLVDWLRLWLWSWLP